MDLWNVLEYLTWALSILFGLHMLYDLWKVDTSYDSELLTSSREGEIELTQERHEI